MVRLDLNGHSASGCRVPDAGGNLRSSIMPVVLETLIALTQALGMLLRTLLGFANVAAGKRLKLGLAGSPIAPFGRPPHGFLSMDGFEHARKCGAMMIRRMEHHMRLEATVAEWAEGKAIPAMFKGVSCALNGNRLQGNPWNVDDDRLNSTTSRRSICVLCLWLSISTLHRRSPRPP
jgi:hypothetical protein